MLTKYECHITMIGDPDRIEAAVLNEGWKFSKIDGDPVMGDGVKCYATQNTDSRLLLDCIMEMERVAAQLETGGASVVRVKVEEIVYDKMRSQLRL